MVSSTFPLCLIAVAVGFVSGQEKPNEECLKPPPGFPQRPPRCCDLPFPIEEMKKQFPTCLQSVPRPPPPSGPQFHPQNAAAFRQASACLETCVFNRVGVMKSGGKEMDEEKFKMKITNSVTVPWSEVASSAADTCFAQMKEMKLPEGGSCSEQPIAFAHCFRRQLFLNCPKEMWAGTNDCNLIKQQMEACPMLPPPPPGLPEHDDFRPPL